MSLFQYLELQPIEPQEDGTVSDLDKYDEDEVIDLTQDEDGKVLAHEWEKIIEALHSGNHEE
jgi:hypothetical protein